MRVPSGSTSQGRSVSDRLVGISNRLKSLERHSQRPLEGPGTGLIRLDNGDPGIAVPAVVADAISSALAAGATHYGPPLGSDQLRVAIAERYGRQSGRELSPREVLITHGATAALSSAAAAVLNTGDKVIIPEPSYSIFPDVVRFAGARPVFVPQPAPGYELDLDQIATEAREAKMIILCNPCSPTGTVYSKDQLHAVAQVAIQEDLLIIADEVYDSVVFDGSSFTSLLDIAGIRDRLLYVQSFSKKFAMAGLRIGFLVTPEWAHSACARAHRTINGPPNTLMQAAALAALTADGSWLTHANAIYARRRDLLLSLINNSRVLSATTPASTLFAWVKHPASMRSMDVRTKAAAAGVAIRSGVEFGPSGEGHFAVTFAVAEAEIVEGMARLTPVFSGH